MLQLAGVGKNPLTGGPASSLKPTIAVTMPYEIAAQNVAISSGQMTLTSIYLAANQTVSNINFVSSGTAESGGSHLWFALYDDGRGSTTANQLALLGQTADQTGAAAFAANTNLGLALNSPVITTYTGIYYVAIMCVGTTPTLAGLARFSTATIQTGTSLGTNLSMNVGSGLTTTAPNPSGGAPYSNATLFAYVS